MGGSGSEWESVIPISWVLPEPEPEFQVAPELSVILLPQC